MIAVVGRLDAHSQAVARRAVAAGGSAELVATVPHGAAGDRALAELASAGVGHAAVLRSPSASLDPVDLELALRYLPDIRVVVVAADLGTLAGPAASAAAWSRAALVAVVGDGDGSPDLPGDASLLEAPSADPDEAFAGVVGAYAAGLDRGLEPRAAWREVERELGAASVSPRRVTRPPEDR